MTETEMLSEEQLIALERVGWPTEIQRLIRSYTALRDQLAQLQAENERLASQLKEWQEEKDTKAGYL